MAAMTLSENQLSEENGNEMYEINNACAERACKATVFHWQICKFVRFLPSLSLWSLKLSTGSEKVSPCFNILARLHIHCQNNSYLCIALVSVHCICISLYLITSGDSEFFSPCCFPQHSWQGCFCFFFPPRSSTLQWPLRCQCSAHSEARIFERRGHSVSKGEYSPDCHVDLHAVFWF